MECEKTELIEVVRISDHQVRNGMAGEVVAAWEADQARQALALVADLPGSELYRCFSPGWGIRAHSPTDLLFEVAFCFRCHGAELWGPSVPAERQGIQDFDPDSPAALELLERFRACQPH